MRRAGAEGIGIAPTERSPEVDPLTARFPIYS